MSRIALYPGSFDPITAGHVDIVLRATTLFDHVIVAVGINPRKKGLFTTEERIDIMEMVFQRDCKDFELGDKVSVASFEGSVARFSRQIGASAVIRGLRALTDFEFEQQYAHTLKRLEPSIEPVFLMTSPENSYISSSLVKELMSIDEPIAGLVPPAVRERMRQKLHKFRG